MSHVWTVCVVFGLVSSCFSFFGYVPVLVVSSLVDSPHLSAPR